MPENPAPRRRLRIPRVTADLDALRASRELRLLVLGNFVSGLGTQAALVALPLASPRFSVASGGIACVACAGLVVAAFPALARYDKDAAIAATAAP